MFELLGGHDIDCTENEEQDREVRGAREASPSVDAHRGTRKPHRSDQSVLNTLRKSFHYWHHWGVQRKMTNRIEA